MFDAYVQSFGEDWVETRTDGPDTYVRLKTYAETKARFEEPGNFLLMPGVEITQTLNGVAVHQNYINLPLIVPCITGADLVLTLEGDRTAADLIRLNAIEARQAAAERQAPYLFMLNHPFWVYYDIVPHLIDCPEYASSRYARFGVCPASPGAILYRREVLGCRQCVSPNSGQDLLYGVGSMTPFL